MLQAVGRRCCEQDGALELSAANDSKGEARDAIELPSASRRIWRMEPSGLPCTGPGMSCTIGSACECLQNLHAVLFYAWPSFVSVSHSISYSHCLLLGAPHTVSYFLCLVCFVRLLCTRLTWTATSVIYLSCLQRLRNNTESGDVRFPKARSRRY